MEKSTIAQKSKQNRGGENQFVEKRRVRCGSKWLRTAQEGVDFQSSPALNMSFINEEFVVLFALSNEYSKRWNTSKAKEARRHLPNILAVWRPMFNVFILILIIPFCMQYAMLSFSLSHPYNPYKSFVHYRQKNSERRGGHQFCTDDQTSRPASRSAERLRSRDRTAADQNGQRLSKSKHAEMAHAVIYAYSGALPPGMACAELVGIPP